MYNHRKLKSSVFLKDDLYPERVLSKHKHYKKSGLYAILKSQLLPSSSVDGTTSNVVKSSQMLLEGIPKLYLKNPLDKEKDIANQNLANTGTTALCMPTTKLSQVAPRFGAKDNRVSGKNTRVEPVVRESSNQKIQVKERGLQEMGSSSFTNGLLESGHRYFHF